MNYEKAYQEALERAKNLHKDAIDMGENIRAKQCEIIFPELKESEDEKIRKALIRFHKSTIDVDGIKGEDILAWLEKQGEQKPFDHENANIQQKDFAPKASTANRQLYNRAILAILSNHVEKYPDVRFGQMLCNLDVNPHFDEESRETYCNLNETINKSKDESKN